MTEEVKITVIATGFNREARAAADIAAAQRGFGQRHAVAEPMAVQVRAARDLDSPTFLRRTPAPPAAPSGRAAEGPVNLGYASLQDELDVPTFLRKQMD